MSLSKSSDKIFQKGSALVEPFLFVICIIINIIWVYWLNLLFTVYLDEKEVKKIYFFYSK